MSIFTEQKAFMLAAKQLPSSKTASLYSDLMAEEVEEFMDAQEEIEQVKEALDVIYVAAGYLNSLGIDVEAAWSAVHESNMDKVRGQVHHREDGKVMKPEEWKRSSKAKLYGILETILEG